MKNIPLEKFFKCRKKGKTRGRPSKQEKILESMCDHFFRKHQAKIQKLYMDTVIYGAGVLKLEKKDFW